MKTENRSKPPKGYRVRLGPAMGGGRYNSFIQDTSGFHWSPECTSREDAIRRAWEHYDRKLSSKP